MRWLRGLVDLAAARDVSLVLDMRRIILGFVVGVCFTLSSPAHAAPDAFIPPKFKGIILSAPVPNYPESVRSHYTLGAQGIYRLTVNPKNGTVDEVGVLNKAGNAKLDAVVVFEFFKWKFKPGALKQLDVPVMFEREVRVELKNAAAR